MSVEPGWDAGAPPEALTNAVRALSRASLLVVGDAMLDTYVHGTVERVSPEAPVPILSVEREQALPGGAGNVVRNLGALGAAVAFVSVVGDDQAGSDLTGLIGGQPSVEPWLLVQGGRITTRKTRFVAQSQHLLRIDQEQTDPIHPKLAERLLRIARDAMAATTVTVLSDYQKGVLTGATPGELIAAARASGRRIVVALQGPDPGRYAGADLLIVSRSAAVRAESLAELRTAHRFGAVMLVRGTDGVTLQDERGTHDFQAEAWMIHDVSGVTDTAVAAAAAALAVGASLETAAQLAALAIGIAASRVGMAVVREDDLMTALAAGRGQPRKIVPRALAAERVERWRRQGWRTAFAEGAFDPLRPAHERLLAHARASCDRLVVGLRSDALLRRSRDDQEPGQPQAERAARLAGLAAVDLVVLHDDDSPNPLLQALRPEIVVGGADRRTEELADADLLNGWGGRVVRTPLLAEEEVLEGG